MPLTPFDTLRYLRALLVLGRVSNLPTVWTNCLAGYLLSGGRDWNLFYFLTTAATCFYLGGMFLNDAMDAEFDRQFRRERPIPQGVISEWKVWCLSFMFLGGGVLMSGLLGAESLKFGLSLTLLIFAYNARHKEFVLAPVIMAFCRLFLFLLAASAGPDGVNAVALWSAVALAAYIGGTAYLARCELSGEAMVWPCVPLVAPIALALIINDGAWKQQGMVVAAVLGLWIFRCLRHAFGPEPCSLPLAVSRLLAGITLVDLAAVGPIHPELVIVFPLALLTALLWQRFVPAT